jgi:hypothetical protein
MHPQLIIEIQIELKMKKIKIAFCPIINELRQIRPVLTSPAV